MKSLLSSIVLGCLLILTLPGKAFSQSASQICIPTKAFDGLVEDSYKATKYESLYNDEVLTTTDLRQQVKFSGAQINSQQLTIESLEQGSAALETKAATAETETQQLTKKVNHLKAVIHTLEGVGGILLVLVLL